MTFFHKRYLDEPGHVKGEKAAESDYYCACQPKACLCVYKNMGSNEVIIFIALRQNTMIIVFTTIGRGMVNNGTQ
jgi:hypothetical protein